MAIGAAVDNANEDSGDLNKESWDKYNLLRAAILDYHETTGAHKSTGDVVLKSLFDTNTILIANADDTPAALTVAASRILGRKSSGNITALTAAEVNAILSVATRALDNLAGVAINTSLISDTDDTDDLGSSSKEWKDLYIDGVARIDSLIADTVAISAGTITGITDLAVADGGTGSSTAANARTALGVAIGSNVLAYDAGLSNLAGIAMQADRFYYTSGDNTHVAGTITAFGRSIIDDANEATFKGTVNLEIGTDVLAQQAIGIADNNLVEMDDANPAQSGDYAKFTANGLQGREVSEVFSDLGLDSALANLTATEIAELEEIGATTISATQWGALGALVEWTDWVPTLTGGADLSGYTSARFYRIGKICFFNFNAETKNVTTGGTIAITLPFTAANTGSNSVSVMVHDGAAWIGQPLVAIDKNTAVLYVYKTVAAGAWAGTENGVNIRANGFFEIA